MHIRVFHPYYQSNVALFEHDFDNVPWNLDIDALNITSLDYRGRMRICCIEASQLLNLFWNTALNEEIQCAFDIYHCKFISGGTPDHDFFHDFRYCNGFAASPGTLFHVESFILVFLYISSYFINWIVYVLCSRLQGDKFNFYFHF